MGVVRPGPGVRGTRTVTGHRTSITTTPTPNLERSKGGFERSPGPGPVTQRVPTELAPRPPYDNFKTELNSGVTSKTLSLFPRPGDPRPVPTSRISEVHRHCFKVFQPWNLTFAPDRVARPPTSDSRSTTVPGERGSEGPSEEGRRRSETSDVVLRPETGVTGACEGRTGTEKGGRFLWSVHPSPGWDEFVPE